MTIPDDAVKAAIRARRDLEIDRLYRSREAAQKYIDTGYTQPEYWEVRGRPVGEWAK